MVMIQVDTYSLIASLSSKGETFSMYSYMLTYSTCLLRQLAMKISCSVIHCKSSGCMWKLTADKPAQQIHSSAVVIGSQLPHSHLKIFKNHI